MSGPIKLLDLELTEPLVDVEGLVAYSRVRFLMRYGGTPVGWLRHVFIHLPLWHLKQCYRWLRSLLRGRKPGWPLSLVLIETAGNLAGPWSLLRSMWRVRRLGRIERSYRVGSGLSEDSNKSDECRVSLD